MTTSLRKALLGLAIGAVAQTGIGQVTINPVSSIRNGDAATIFDESAAEIVAYDYATQQMYVVNGADDAIDIFSISDPANPTLVNISRPEHLRQSQQRRREPALVEATKSPSPWVPVTRPSGETVVFLAKNGTIKGSVEVGFLPGHVDLRPPWLPDRRRQRRRTERCSTPSIPRVPSP